MRGFTPQKMTENRGLLAHPTPPVGVTKYQGFTGGRSPHAVRSPCYSSGLLCGSDRLIGFEALGGVLNAGSEQDDTSSPHHGVELIKTGDVAQP